MFCGIVDTVGRIKKVCQDSYLWAPGFKHLKMRLVRSGSFVTDDTPLCDILARTTAAWNVDFIMESSDPIRLPIKIKRFGENGIEEDLDYEDSQDEAEEYPIYDPDKGTLIVKVEKGSDLLLFELYVQGGKPNFAT